MRIVPAGPASSLHPSFPFFLLSSSDFYPTISRTLADLKLRPERDEGLNIKNKHTHTHTTEGPVHSGSALKKSLSHASLSFLLSVIQRGLFSHTWMNSGLVREQAIDRHAAQHERVIEELARQQHHHKKRIKS